MLCHFRYQWQEFWSLKCRQTFLILIVTGILPRIRAENPSEIILG